MKKIWGLLVVGLLVPMGVSALKVEDPVKCTAVDTDGYKTCTLNIDTEDTSYEEFEATITANGGAEIVSINGVSDEWTVTSSSSNGVYTVKATSIGVKGEYSLFSVKYKVSGEENCNITITLNNNTVSTPKTDTPTESKQTGSTIPYIALGTMLVLASGAYLLTKNKAKMFNI